MEVLHSFSELGALAPGPVAFTVGFFDGVHRGHKALLDALATAASNRAARSLAITFTNSPRGFHVPAKQHPYLTMPDEKLHLLGRTGIDATLLLEYDFAVARHTAAGFIELLSSHVPVSELVIGYDSRFGCDMVGGRDGFTALTNALGIGLTFVEAVMRGGRPVKSRETRELAGGGRMAAVREILGHPYFVMGAVGHGKGKGGAELRVPTANLVMPAMKLAPPMGIYAGVGTVNGRGYPAALCVMSTGQHIRTALESGGKTSPEEPDDPQQMMIEAHLLDFEGSLYGRVLKLDFLKHLRNWINFATPEELREQIRLDVEATRAVVAAEPGLLEV